MVENTTNNWQIVIFGEAGSGKTTFTSKILPNTVPLEDLEAETKTIKPYSGSWLGDGPLIDVYDLPGIGDPDIKIDQLLKMFEDTLAGKSLTAFCFVFRADGNRVTSFHNASLQILRLLVNNQYPWNNIILIGTHADKVDKGTPEESVDKIRKKLNSLELGEEGKASIKPGILRKVVFTEKNPEAGLEQLKRHLNELTTRTITTSKKKPEEKKIQQIFSTTVGGGSNCFAGDMIVRVKREDKVERVKLTELKLFDMIQVNNGSFESVQVLYRYINQDALLLDFEAKIEGKQELVKLSMIPGHYVFLKREGQAMHIPAKEAHIGDVFLYSTKEDGVNIEAKIIKIESRIYDQTINVRTRSRTLIVNDILCSSVVEGDSGILGHEFCMLLGRINKNWPNQFMQAALRLRAKARDFLETKQDS